MRAVRGLACVLLVAGVAGLLASGCDGSQVPETESPEPPGAAEDAAAATFLLASPAFTDAGSIPAMYCLQGVEGGRNISIPLEWTGVPAGTASFAISMIDRHPAADDWVHWIVVDIPAGTTHIAEGASPEGLPAVARELENTFGTSGYAGPQPPPGTGDHEYEITVYALGTDHVDIDGRPSAADIERTLAGQVLASATITGTFGR